MSRYFEFSTTSTGLLRYFAEDMPLHDGEMPTRFRAVKGFRVDGKPIQLRDESLPERTLQACREAVQLKRRGIMIDCIGFVALLSGHDFGQYPDGAHLTLPRVGGHPYDPQHDQFSDAPVNLLREFEDEVWYVHSMYPAHTLTTPSYIHKLGDGPLCFSTLNDAQRMYGSDAADTMPVLRILYTGEEAPEHHF